MDELFESLADPHRRRLLGALREHNPQPDTVPVDEVAPGAAAADRKHLDVELVHVHLPKLEDCGLVEWDRDAHEVTKGPRFDEIRPLLGVVEDLDPADA